jgi:hypothetical protein
MEPFTIIRQEAGVKYELSAQRITHNQFIDHTFFRYPKANTDAPLPDLTSLIQQITANQATLEQRREEYSFRKTVREQELDKNGKEEKTTIKVYDVLPIGRHFVSRLLSVDGQNLSPDKQQKEAKRVTQEIEKIRREQAKALKAKEAKQSNNAKQDDEDAISLLKFLQIIRVTDAYRDRFRGQAVIVIEFEPNKEFKPRNRTESLISKLAGSIFVDEQERQVVRLESRFVEGFKLLGGLASVSPASAFVFEQQKVNNDLWLPAYAEIAIGARVLFSKRNLNNSERYSDYRRYQTDVELKFESE